VGKKLKDESIISIVEDDLCTGCGTCAAICPHHAIEMSENPRKRILLPRVREEKCTNCGSCQRICPGHEVDFKRLNAWIFGKRYTDDFNDILLGHHLKSYSGYSRDFNVRYGSASGGLATEVLLFALSEDLIDGALVTRMSKDRPLQPQPFIARTPRELIESAGSKYCPVPANVALEEILEKKGRYAVVGLPCHIHGIRKAEKVYEKLRERIVLHLGIFCSHTDSLLETEYLLYKLGVNIADVERIDYRGKGWPGMLSINLRSGRCIDVPFHDWIKIHAYCLFSPTRCLLCCDHCAELADISFADAWLPEFLNDSVGTSIAVTRSRTGDDILHQAQSKGKIMLRALEDVKVAESQKMMRFKKNSIAVRFLLFKALGRKLPIYNTEILKPSYVDWPRSAIIFLNRYIAGKRSLWGNLESFANLQNPLERMYKKALRFSS
jgi:coenzyme F420 hydrogenase subunit beta